ncbi:hypothetical protein TrLO_g1763, partial [Triparma laevis f. longispina]
GFGFGFGFGFGVKSSLLLQTKLLCELSLLLETTLLLFCSNSKPFLFGSILGYSPQSLFLSCHFSCDFRLLFEL